MVAEPDAPPRELIACPTCDMLHETVPVPLGSRLRCRRCGTMLISNLRGAVDRALAATITSAILVTAAVTLPFLDISILGIHGKASVIDAAFAYASGLMVPLAIATILVIAVIPMLRALALAYTILPLRLGRRPLPGAARVFRLAARLKPWSMAEIFMIGVAVAVVKVGDMASVSLGPAFWAMAVLVVILMLESANLDERSVWQRLDQLRAS